MPATERQPETGRSLRIWDPFVRLFHWSVAAVFMANYFWLDGDDTPHQWAGYALGGLVIARIAWGFLGPRRARFADFFPTPSRLRAYRQRLRNRDHDPAQGHDPAGGLMILALLLMLAVIAVSGWIQTWDRFWSIGWPETLHQWASDITIALVVLHVLGVILMERLTRLPLIGPMVTGKRRVK